MIGRLNRYLDERPMLAIGLGMLVGFLILYFAAPSLVERADSSQPTHSRGQA